MAHAQFPSDFLTLQSFQNRLWQSGGCYSPLSEDATSSQKSAPSKPDQCSKGLTQRLAPQCGLPIGKFGNNQNVHQQGTYLNQFLSNNGSHVKMVAALV